MKIHNKSKKDITTTYFKSYEKDCTDNTDKTCKRYTKKYDFFLEVPNLFHCFKICNNHFKANLILFHYSVVLQTIFIACCKETLKILSFFTFLHQIAHPFKKCTDFVFQVSGTKTHVHDKIYMYNISH